MAAPDRRDPERLETLREWSRVLDSAFRIPGTRIRFGWDPILGLIPWLGDLVTPLFSVLMIRQALRVRVPKIVLARMLLNVGIDALVGVVPLAGDLFDLGWKANARNLRLLERHAHERARATTGDWIFVGAIVAALLLVAALPMAIVWWFIDTIF